MQLNTAKRASFDEGSLDQYLREISQYPLITREEEVTLAQRIKQSDPEALDKLVRSNLRFVVSVAKKYQNQGVSLSDLINEGNLGLIRAAHKFDETKGIKFISYAVWWIRQAILQALAEQSRIVRVPLNRAGTLHRIGKRSASLLQELGREPTVEEIAEGMDISEEEVAKTLSISQAHLSLDAPLTPGEDNKLLDYLPDTQNPGPDDEIFEHALTESIEEVLATLKEREAKILRLYFGLEGQEPMTLEEIGSLLGIAADNDFKMRALLDVRQAKLVKRAVRVKNLDLGPVTPAANDTVRREIKLTQGIPQEKAKAIVKAIKDRKFKKAQASIQGEEIRVQAPAKDELQEVIAFLRTQDFGLELRFGNYRG